MNRAAIIAAYAECEAEARAVIECPALLPPEIVRDCVTLAAEACGVSYDDARDVLVTEWAKHGG